MGEAQVGTGSTTLAEKVALQVPSVVPHANGLLQQILTWSSDCIKLLDLQGNVLFISEGGLRALGVQDGTTLLGRCWTDFWSGDDRTNAAAAVDRARGGGAASFVGLCPTAAGEPRWWDVSLTPIPGPDGSPERLLCISRDITDRKLAEEGQRKSDQRFRRMIEQSPLSVQILDPSGRILEVNRAWEGLWGVTLDMVRDFNTLNDPQLQARGVVNYVRRALSGESVEVPPVPFVPDRGKFEGQERWVRTFMYPVIVGHVVEEIVVVQEDITERLQTEERHRTFFELAGVGAARSDPNTGRFLEVNRKLCEMTGYTREELLGRTVREITYPDDLNTMRERFGLLLAGEIQECLSHKRYVRKDGTPIWVAVSASILRDLSGNPQQVVAIIADIDAQKRAEMALQASEEQHRTLVDAMPLVAWTLTDEGRIDYMNQWYFGYTGIDALTPPDVAWANLVHPEDSALGRESYRAAVAQGQPWEHEVRLRRHDGEWRWHLSRLLPLKDEDGNVFRWIGTSTDIHDQKEAQRALESASRQQAFLVALDDAIRPVSSPQEVMALAESRLAEYLDVSRCSYGVIDDAGIVTVDTEFVRGLPSTAGTHRLSVYPKASVEAYQRGETVVHYDTATQPGTADHFKTVYEPIGLRASIAVPLVKDGRLLAIFGACDHRPRQWTSEEVWLVQAVADRAWQAIERARAEQALRTLAENLEDRVQERTAQLQAAHDEMEGFTYSVSHDLRTPLRSIVGTSTILMEDFGDILPEPAKDQLARQAQAARKMAHLIDDLLKLSRLSREEVTLKDVDLSQLAQEVAGSVVPKEREDLTICVQPGMAAKADPRLLWLVFSNLIENACKFSPDGGTITVGEEDGTFFVRDEGIGFEQQYAHKMFLPFERLVRDQDYAGTGIGLANVQRIVQRHGGRVWAEGSPGNGATIYFTLGQG
jgi:PAS domain S-box-containing protein